MTINKSGGCLPTRLGVIFAAMILTAIFAVLTAGTSTAETVKQRSFKTPDQAIAAVIKALESKDNNALGEIFGPESQDVMSSGDQVADQAAHEGFLKLYKENSRLEQTDHRAVLFIGNDDYPFPVPLTKNDSVWTFDIDEGWDEIRARRIGENELDTIQICLAYVDAQREYARKNFDADGLRQYAQKFKSDEGTKNGLYWKVKAGDELSPLGALFAVAHEEGYKSDSKNWQPVPYHGYYFRILTAQGMDALGGAYNYIVGGKMIGGFAMVAYPARYEYSGIMSFMVNHTGKVFQADLGDKTSKAAQAMTYFNPDSKWHKVE